MSLWRKEASERLPELQKIIASRDVDSPMMLWLEIRMEFQNLCAQDPPPLDLIKRVWEYAKWCMAEGHGDVANAAALGFCEHLLDRNTTRDMLPKVMTRQEYEGLKGLLLYHKTEDDFAKGLKLFR